MTRLRRTRRPVASSTVRQELDQSPEWWDREYRALMRQVFPPKPFDPAEHEGHCIVEDRTLGGVVLFQACTECPSE
jgi:hypothetical protein